MSAGATYTPISSTTLTSNTASVDLTSFSGYTDLVVVFSGQIIKSTGTADSLLVRVGNSTIDTGANYSYTNLTGDGSTASSGRTSGDTRFWSDVIAASTAGTSFSTIVYNFQNYANTTTNKTVLFRTSTPTFSVDARVALWRSTSAITIIRFYPYSGTAIASGSTFTLYGILAA